MDNGCKIVPLDSPGGSTVPMAWRPHGARFYRAMICTARTMLRQDVRLSVRLSITRRYSIETAKHITKLFTVR